MEVKFIAQGLEPSLNSPSGGIIIDALTSGLYNSFKAFTAFVSSGGVNNIKEQLSTFMSNGNDVHLYAGVDLHGTSKEALDLLIENAIPTTIVYSPNNIVYHPKIYLFSGDNDHLIIIGSSNLTTSGLFQNVEASICMTFKSDDSQGIAVENSILQFFDSVINGTSESSKPLSQTLIDVLVNSNVVLGESTTRETRNSMNDVLPKVSCENADKLKSTFKKIHVTRPPKGHKKVVRGEVITTATAETTTPTVTYLSESIDGHSMWIESGQMTGGSRNILDLSKQGKRDGVVKFGSVEFFDVDKDDSSIEKDITLIYDGKEYTGNTIKYAPRNSNWRIQLKGVTTSKDKFTDVLRANGSQNRVFIFERTTDSNKYKFHILDSDDIDQLKDMSSDWTHGGKGGKGRMYGIIND